MVFSKKLFYKYVLQPYKHESQRVHPLKRAKGNGGQFLNTKKLQQSKSTPTSHGPDMSRSPQLHLPANISKPDVYQPKNFKDSGSATSCSDVRSPSNSDEMFQQPDFRFSSYCQKTTNILVEIIKITACLAVHLSLNSICQLSINLIHYSLNLHKLNGSNMGLKFLVNNNTLCSIRKHGLSVQFPIMMLKMKAKKSLC